MARTTGVAAFLLVAGLGCLLVAPVGCMARNPGGMSPNWSYCTAASAVVAVAALARMRGVALPERIMLLIATGLSACAVGVLVTGRVAG